MCNRYANRVSYRGYVEELSETGLPLVVPGPEHAPNLEPRDNIRPTDRGHVLLPAEGGLELREMRWGLIPWFHKKPVKEWKVLTTNARSERSRRSPATEVPLRTGVALSRFRPSTNGPARKPRRPNGNSPCPAPNGARPRAV